MAGMVLLFILTLPLFLLLIHLGLLPPWRPWGSKGHATGGVCPEHASPRSQAIRLNTRGRLSCSCRQPESLHLNSASQLPPVDCPLLIEVGHALVPAHRESFVQSRDHELTFLLADGSKITGRYRWTYP